MQVADPISLTFANACGLGSRLSGRRRALQTSNLAGGAKQRLPLRTRLRLPRLVVCALETAANEERITDGASAYNITSATAASSLRMDAFPSRMNQRRRMHLRQCYVAKKDPTDDPMSLLRCTLQEAATLRDQKHVCCPSMRNSIRLQFRFHRPRQKHKERRVQ